MCQSTFDALVDGHSGKMEPDRELLPESDDDITDARDTIEHLEQSITRPPVEDSVIGDHDVDEDHVIVDVETSDRG